MKHARIDEYADLDEARPECFQIHRNLLQSSSTSPDARLPLAQRLRSRKRSGISSVIFRFRLCPKVVGYRNYRLGNHWRLTPTARRLARRVCPADENSLGG